MFLRGAIPTPRYKLAAAIPHLVAVTPPPQAAFVPKQLSIWGNDRFGDCVTAEEAFAKACYDPEIFIPETDVIAWASKHGVLNGADLLSVVHMMQNSGFVQGQQTYLDGSATSVDYTNELTLQSALSQGPVKIGIDANALPSGAGSHNGWVGLGHGNVYRQEDHCVSLCGYGPAEWLAQQLGIPLPSNLQPKQTMYLLFTWGTIGFVDHAWILSTTAEAWLRSPTTIGNPPLTPTPGPAPTPTPTPVPNPISYLTLLMDVFAIVRAIPSGIAAVQAAVSKLLSDLGLQSRPQVVTLAAQVGAVNWISLLGDVLAIYVAYTTGNIPAIEAAVIKMLADLGIHLP